MGQPAGQSQQNDNPSKPGVIQLGSLEIVLLVVVIIIIFKMFILTGCPCGCGAMSSMWCQCANNLNDLREEIKEKENENPSVSVKDKPTIYYHYTEWCGYCKKMRPLWDSVKSQMNEQAFFIENDEDKNRTPSVNSYPTVIAHVDGQKITYSGGYTEAELLKFVQDAVNMKN